MIISKLNKEDYIGKKFTARYMTKGYYDIQRVSNGFDFTYTEFDEEKEVSFEDSFFNEWLEEPVAYGAFEDGELLGFVEGTIETWNNRYRRSRRPPAYGQPFHRRSAGRNNRSVWITA